MTELSPQPVTATQPPGGWALRASGRSRLLLAAVTGAALVAFVAGWALPNVAGPVFVQVRAIATAQKGSVIGASVSIAGASEVPAGALNVVTGDRDTGRAVVQHKTPAMVSITGSVRAGMQVAESAAHDVKRVHLELGI